MGVNQADLMKTIKKVWASLFNSIATRYASEHKVNLLEAGMAVIVQQMVEPDVAGVVNTTKSIKDAHIIEVEAARGLGEAIVSGAITPDTYYIDKHDLNIVEKMLAVQRRILTLSGWKDLKKEDNTQKLTDDEILALTKVAIDIEQLFEAPQDIEFVFQNGEVHIVQTRPQTGLEVSTQTSESVESYISKAPSTKLIATGLKGKVEIVLEGVARVIKSPSEGGKFEAGDILVAPMATPVWDPILYRAGAIITDEGGATSHAIRVANERRIPAIVGTGDATRLVSDGDKVVIDTTASDSFKGKVYLLKDK
jgi:pyruvate,water dikinase